MPVINLYPCDIPSSIFYIGLFVSENISMINAKKFCSPPPSPPLTIVGSGVVVVVVGLNQFSFCILLDFDSDNSFGTVLLSYTVMMA